MIPTLKRGEHSNCPVRGVLDRIGDKWSVLVVIKLGERSHRFNELRREVGDVSQRMLTRALRNLEREGLVSRTIHPTTPPQVEYALTDLGRTLLEPLTNLIHWAEEKHDVIREARQTFDRREGELSRNLSTV